MSAECEKTRPEREIKVGNRGRGRGERRVGLKTSDLFLCVFLHVDVRIGDDDGSSICRRST